MSQNFKSKLKNLFMKLSVETAERKIYMALYFSYIQVNCSCYPIALITYDLCFTGFFYKTNCSESHCVTHTAKNAGKISILKAYIGNLAVNIY